MAKRSPALLFGAALLSHSSVGTIELPNLTPAENLAIVSAATARSRKSVEYGLGIDLVDRMSATQVLILGSARPALISWLSLLMISTDVLRGAPEP